MKKSKGDLTMKYNQIVEERLYEYGEGKELKTREEAYEKAKMVKKNVKTELALIKLWEFSNVEIIKVNNAFKVVITISIPSIFELNNRNSK